MIEKESINEITILTPCYNAENYILRTVKSVINQEAVLNNRVKLTYYVLDGGSTDNTLNILSQVRSKNLIVISEQDKGMYDALAKGIEKVQGGWCAYLNAGDYYHPLTFDIVLDVARDNPQVKWLTGYSVYYTEQGYPVIFKLPFKYRNRLIQSGFYDGRLPFIQQEATFWESGLHDQVNLQRLASFKMAGDYYLWHCFSKRETLHIVEAYLGGFCIHAGQASENVKAYKTEMAQFISKKSVLDWSYVIFDNLLWLLPNKIKLKFNSLMHRYNHTEKRW